MSDTTMREAVLEEFTYDAGVHRLCRVTDMADEIRRLRDENTALSAEINRLTRILAALREPSNAVILAADKKIPILYSLRDTKAAIIAAVETAEQEVGDE